MNTAGPCDSLRRFACGRWTTDRLWGSVTEDPENKCDKFMPKSASAAAQSTGEIGERDGVDGLLRARHRQQVPVARCAEDAGTEGDPAGDDERIRRAVVQPADCRASCSRDHSHETVLLPVQVC